MSLVADYGESSPSESESSSSNSDSDDEQSPIEQISPTEVEITEKLPTPDFCDASSSSSTKNSVFSNPFKEAENAKQAILEKHVKMVDTQDNVRTINGKKICWNYRKGRCRFGHNCIYAHDSDIRKSKEQLQDQTQTNKASNDSKGVLATEKVIKNKGKKRPGLTQGLVPGKKVMKAYHEQHSKPIFVKQK